MARVPARPRPADSGRARPRRATRLDLTDEELHERLPTALERHHTENRNDVLMVPGKEYNQASWDAPVRLIQNLFV